MKNDYEVRGDTTTIFLPRKDEPTLATLIDTADLEIVESEFRCLHANWSKDSRSYYVIGKSTSLPRRNLIMHRVILSAPDGLMVDHIDHNTLDNRRSNIRLVTRSENGLNRRGPTRGNRHSGFRGVRFHPLNTNKPWHAVLTFQKKQMSLGYYPTPEQAASVVNAKLAELTGATR